MRSTTLRRWWLAPVAATALLLGLTNPATGQSDHSTRPLFVSREAKALRAAGVTATSGGHGGVTVVADRLNNPRGLDLASGALYVAEAGRGGPCLDPVEGPCVGLTSSITKVSHGGQRRIVTGLLSIAGPDGTGAVGVDDVSVARRGGGLFMIATTLGCPDQLPAGLTPELLRQNGKLLRARHGAKRVVADITAFECANDPDGQGVESDPYSVYAASNRHQVVADAAGDSILDVRDGRVSLLAVIPSSANGTDQVPTSVVKGPDGAWYVGTLAEGAGNGGAKVWRIVPGHAPEVYVDGLTAVVDIAFGPDGSLYASEFLTDLTTETDPSGAVVRVRPDGRRTVLGQGSLFVPGGIAVDRHGNLYVANWSILPATGSSDPVFPPDARGQVVRLRTH